MAYSLAKEDSVLLSATGTGTVAWVSVVELPSSPVATSMTGCMDGHTGDLVWLGMLVLSIVILVGLFKFAPRSAGGDGKCER